MPKYGKNLEHLFEKFDQKFTQKTILLLGISILEIFEKVHASGYTYNDLKLDNILIVEFPKLLHRRYISECLTRNSLATFFRKINFLASINLICKRIHHFVNFSLRSLAD
jgi:serine/threonine protein kinase